VIIPTLNEEHYIGDLLNDLKSQSYDLHEILVVDGNSEDKTVEVVKRFSRVEVIYSDRSVGKQRNFGGEKATGEVIAFLDADTRVGKDFFKNVISRFEERKLELACPLYSPYKSNLVTNIVFWYVNVVFVLLAGILPSGAGPCMIVRKDVFMRESGFLPDQTFEDMEWIRRLGRKYRFGIILKTIKVSDRRFRTYGMFRMIILYILISILFTFGLFRIVNKVKYTFGGYKK
jgi:glycosyltransferase involved in cell wall biosynthesis